jgi:anti-anti-sigma factor
MAGLRIEPLPSERGFRLCGELDVYTVGAAREALEPELHGRLVLELAELDFIDDSGLGLLVGAYKRLRQQDGSLVLRNPTESVRRVFRVTGVADLSGFEIEPDAGL